jgi:predicted nucleic acid-binding protein
VARTEPVLVDSNVILDIAYEDPHWRGWSEAAVEQAAEESVLVINPIIFAEVSVGYARAEHVEAVMPANRFRREPLPYQAAFLAGKAFLSYRRQGGTKTSPLPDFYIGAHAALRRYRLLTRDAARYRTYFPTVELIAP